MADPKDNEEFDGDEEIEPDDSEELYTGAESTGTEEGEESDEEDES